ncbi:MAG: hypothetical protein CMI73_01915 [Candidatus Pelagibacter sp.]|nr:hypothetical protein [Candidatus Pelagibacter sp.]|tara:strand:+ start:17203 stop:17826 length:624 start_codon:yes stop_codon:yes gene_type:complete
MEKDKKDKDKASIIKKIRNYFLAGIVVLIPIGITIYFSIFIERAFSNLLPKYLNPNNLLPIDVPGLEILITFFIITFIGMLSVTFVGKYFLSLNEKLFNKIPVLKTIFNGLTQLTNSFASVDNDNKKKMVLIEYPRKGIYSLGFATSINKGEVTTRVGEKMVNIFVPTTPNPTSGFLLMVPEKDVIYLDMSFEEASKFIMSAGSIKS